MSEQAAGFHVDSAGVTVELDDDEVVTDVIVIAKVTKLGGDHPDDRIPRLCVQHGAATDWITYTGLIHATCSLIDQPPEAVDSDD